MQDPGRDDGKAFSGRGPFRVRRRYVRRRDDGTLGSAVISWPAAAPGPLGAVVVIPGYTGHRLTVGWYGPRLASFGFAVMTINSLGRHDDPEARSVQLLAALDVLCERSPISERIDPARRAVIGHSMGGTGALIAASRDSRVRAAVLLAPWSRSHGWSQVRTPTLIIAAGADRVAPPAAHARSILAGLPAATPQRYVELPGASHYAPLFRPKRAIQTPVVEWLTRYVGSGTATGDPPGDDRSGPAD